MNLIIDIGNSQTKCAVFDKGQIIHRETVAILEQPVIGKYPFHLPGRTGHRFQRFLPGSGADEYPAKSEKDGYP